MTELALRAPFPWYGGKARAAAEIWRRFGNPDYYIEPFAGSLAVLLANPERAPKGETVNDADALVTNFWRAAKLKPAELVEAAQHPLNQIEMKAHHRTLQEAKPTLAEQLVANADYCDARLAGWWLHGICASFGEAWLHRKYGQMPSMRRGGLLLRTISEAKEWMQRVRDRLERVRVCHGDWQSLLTPIQLGMRDRRESVAAVLLDPPYADVAVKYGAGDGRVSARVRAWCIEHGENRRLRIALCGYEGEHEMPGGWACVKWVSTGGLAKGKGSKTANRFRERIWFSPGCLQPA